MYTNECEGHSLCSSTGRYNLCQRSRIQLQLGGQSRTKHRQRQQYSDRREHSAIEEPESRIARDPEQQFGGGLPSGVFILGRRTSGTDTIALPL